jgi:3-dehydro-L-gulonate 2-dehydrogenase
MSNSANTTLIPAVQMQDVFEKILLKNGMPTDRAHTCAEIFTQNSIDGVYTHGVNRFPRFVQYLRDGYVIADAEPTLVHKFGGIEQWNGNLAPGPINALYATDRALELASAHGIACVSLANTNHWMRGGTYGWKAAKAGFIFIGWTNTIANMPAWGALDAKLGNNPFVMAIPYGDEAIVLDMAMSQYSFGALEQAALKAETLPVPGGYNAAGELSTDPAGILETGRSIPIGFWKGAGFSLLLDILASILSGGAATHEVSKTKVEYGVSQVFIAIDPQKLGNHAAIARMLEDLIQDYHASSPMDEGQKISFPGERVLATRTRNLALGIPVLQKVWAEIEGLMSL